jgi:hypothetical protein
LDPLKDCDHWKHHCTQTNNCPRMPSAIHPEKYPWKLEYGSLFLKKKKKKKWWCVCIYIRCLLLLFIYSSK